MAVPTIAARSGLTLPTRISCLANKDTAQPRLTVAPNPPPMFGFDYVGFGKRAPPRAFLVPATLDWVHRIRKPTILLPGKFVNPMIDKAGLIDRGAITIAAPPLVA